MGLNRVDHVMPTVVRSRLRTPIFGESALLGPFGHPQASDTLHHSRGHKTQVTSLIGGGQIFQAIDALLSRAKQSVMVNLYSLEDPVLNPERLCSPAIPGSDRQRLIVQKLAQAARQGIKVTAILDSGYDDRDGTYKNDQVMQYLRSNGVEVLAYPRKFAKLNHVKAMVVDNQFAVLGGMNWGNHSAVNHDACVMLEGDDVSSIVHKLFKPDYVFSGGNLNNLELPPVISEEAVRVVTTAPAGSPGGRKNTILKELLRRIEQAQDSIICEVYTLTDRLVADKLIAAHNRLKRRGKPGVRILVDPTQYVQSESNRPIVDYLRDKGVPIRFYKVDWRTQQKLHAKWAVFDSRHLFIGSANWSKAGLQTDGGKHSTRRNHEANLSIDSAPLCRPFTQQFEQDWTKQSLPLNTLPDLIADIPEEVRHRMKSLALPPASGGKQNPFAQGPRP